jgi:hypothetical protein
MCIRHRNRPANPVLDVDHAELELPPRSKFAQGMQQEHRIRAARYSDADALSGLEHAVSSDEFGYAIQHSIYAEVAAPALRRRRPLIK